jgi:hypothetical protein
MSTDDSPVIVKVGPWEGHAVETTRVHHRHFPEVHAEGESAAAAGTHLTNLLARALDGLPSGDRREAVERAIAEVKDFVSKAP